MKLTSLKDLQQVQRHLAEAVGIAPCLGLHAAIGLLDVKRHFDAGQQHGLGTQQALQLDGRYARRIEVFRVGPDAHAGAALAAAGAGFSQGADLLATAGKLDGPDLSFAPYLDRDAGRQRIGDGDADAVQAAGKGVGRIAGALVELAAGMEAGEGQHHHRDFLVGMEADRNAAAVVGDGDRAIQMQ